MKRIAAEIWRAEHLEVEVVVLAQTKKQAAKITTEWNLFIGLLGAWLTKPIVKN